MVNQTTDTSTRASTAEHDAIAPIWRDLASGLMSRWKLLLGASVLAGAAGYAGSYLVTPTFTARASFLSPQQQNSAASAIASLGALSGLAGAAAGIKNPADQYVALMQSRTVSDRMIDKFNLLTVYERKFRADAQKELASNTRVAAGKRDNLITVEADDVDPARAANMANAYIEELRTLSNGLALTEAQQRRMFFEKQLQQTRDKLAEAQTQLQKSGFTSGALKSEPKAAADSYARVKAQLMAAEISLQMASRSLTDQAPEVRNKQAAVEGLRAQLRELELPATQADQQNYVGAYREFKYNEVLFELFARQFEFAKLDESREGAMFQVVDAATVPERKSAPKRSLYLLFAGFAGLLLASLYAVSSVLRKSTWQSPTA